LNLYKKTKNTSFFSSVNDIPEAIWQQLRCTNNLYFNSGYLAAIEKNNPKISFFYLVLFDKKEEAIALANLQIITFSEDVLDGSLEEGFDKLKCFVRKIFFRKQQPLKVLICGNSFVSGEHGIFIKQNQDKKEVLKAIVKSIKNFVNLDQKLKNEIDLFVIKDFVKESISVANELHNYKYYSFKAEPNMVLKVDKNWQSFDDYLAAMKTKFRVKAKKAITLSDRLEIEDVTAEDIKKQLPEMTALYQKVATKADFNLGEFNLETYQSLKETLGDNYIVRTYRLEGEIIGFLSGIVTKKELDAHFVGINYSLNRECAIYQRMLYDYIQIAISRRLELINFGRTASEIKSSVGATPQDLTIYLRHKKSIKNRLLKLFLKRISPTKFSQKHPFKIVK